MYYLFKQSFRVLKDIKIYIKVEILLHYESPWHLFVHSSWEGIKIFIGCKLYLNWLHSLYIVLDHWGLFLNLISSIVLFKS
jgi:hypothetical protein